MKLSISSRRKPPRQPGHRNISPNVTGNASFISRAPSGAIQQVCLQRFRLRRIVRPVQRSLWEAHLAQPANMRPVLEQMAAAMGQVRHDTGSYNMTEAKDGMFRFAPPASRSHRRKP